MRLIIVMVALLALVSVPVFAADSVTLKTKMGDVTFNHKAHGERETCKACHQTEPPAKFAIGGKDAAHKMCAGCHTTKKAGPQASKCMECHKKK